MAIEDDDKPRKKISHEIGQDLSLLSVEELAERIALMNSEIERLQVAMTKKARIEGRGEQLFQIVSSRPLDDPAGGPVYAGARNLGGDRGERSLPNERSRSGAARQRIAKTLQAFHSANGRHGKRSLNKSVRLRSIKLSRL